MNADAVSILVVPPMGDPYGLLARSPAGGTVPVVGRLQDSRGPSRQWHLGYNEALVLAYDKVVDSLGVARACEALEKLTSGAPALLWTREACSQLALALVEQGIADRVVSLDANRYEIGETK